MNINQPPKPLGSTTQRVLTFLHKYDAEHPYAPILSEIAVGCQLASRSVAAYHLSILERRGLITRGPLGAHRATALVKEPTA